MAGHCCQANQPCEGHAQQHLPVLRALARNAPQQLWHLHPAQEGTCTACPALIHIYQCDTAALQGTAIPKGIAEWQTACSGPVQAEACSPPLATGAVVVPCHCALRQHT